MLPARAPRQVGERGLRDHQLRVDDADLVRELVRGRRRVQRDRHRAGREDREVGLHERHVVAREQHDPVAGLEVAGQAGGQPAGSACELADRAPLRGDDRDAFGSDARLLEEGRGQVHASGRLSQAQACDAPPRDGCHAPWELSNQALKLRAARVVTSPVHTAGQPVGGGGEPASAVAGPPVSRSGVPVAVVDVWSYRDLPGRPRNVASQPAPKRLRCGRTPNSIASPHSCGYDPRPSMSGRSWSTVRASGSAPGSRSRTGLLDPEGELEDRGDQDHRQQRDEDHRRSRPHRRGSRPKLTGTPGSSVAGAPSTATVTALPLRRPSSAAADRRSSASVHMP